MKKIIKQFLPVGLALIAMVMLLGIALDREPPAETAPGESAPGSTETTAQTEEAAAVSETMPEDARPLVEAALGNYVLDRTATASCIYDDGLHESDDTTGAGRAACGHALANLCDEEQMNPVAVFWLLKEQSLYESRASREDRIETAAFQLPIQARKEYPYTSEGTRALLSDILQLSSAVEDGMGMDDTVLGVNDKVDSFQVFYDEDDKCYYTYFVLYGERSAHFLCFYTRGDEQIDDLEFQMLNLCYAEGDAEELERIAQLGDRQAATIMAAAEQLLAGTSRADEGSIPMGYTCDDCEITIERYAITGNGETGMLTNYDLRIAK